MSMVQIIMERQQKINKKIHFYLMKAKYIAAKMEKNRREMVCGL
jgi:hypothetical protein